MLVVDLDGTTLDHEGRLSDVDVAAARALALAGIPVTIATGRLFTGTRWVAEALGVRGTVAVMNGSELVDVQSGETRHARTLAASVRTGMHGVLSSRGFGTFLFGTRRIHYGADHERHAPYLSIWTRELERWGDVFDAPDWHTGDDVLAVGVVGHPDALSELRDHLRLQLPAEIETVLFGTFDGHGFLKIRHAADDKGTALARLAEERGLGIADCVAVGDWTNDIPMLQVAGRSFAMGHAREEVRIHADEVLDASRDGGAIAEVARKVWDIG
ncbi:MAG: HAD hydrolase family protein [Myxococcota bacterium]